MTRQQCISRAVASLILGLPSLAAIYGSAASLKLIAEKERLSAAATLPFCLDILAIGIVVSSVFCRHDDRLSRVTPWLVYGASAALQVSDVSGDGPRAWAVHALPLAAAILGTEKILRLWRPTDVREHVPALVHPQTVPDLQVEAINGTSTVPAVVVQSDVPVAPRPRPAKRAARSTTRHQTPTPRPFDPEGTDKVLLERAEKAAADLGRPLDQLTRDELLAWLRSKGWGVRATRVDDVLRYAREHP